MRIHLLGALLVLALGATPGAAQTLRDSLRARAIELLPIGTKVRLVAAGHEYTGPLADRNAVALTLNRDGSPLTVPQMDIQAMWVPKGTAALDGFLLGGIVGAIPGGILGWVYGGFMCESGCDRNMTYGAIAGAAAGGLAAGMVGAIIGSAFTTWERRFP